MLPAALQNRNIYKEFYKKLNKKELKNLQKRRKKNFFPLKKLFSPSSTVSSKVKAIPDLFLEKVHTVLSSFSFSMKGSLLEHWSSIIKKPLV